MARFLLEIFDGYFNSCCTSLLFVSSIELNCQRNLNVGNAGCEEVVQKSASLRKSVEQRRISIYNEINKKAY